jgi:hypothetical protein
MEIIRLITPIYGVINQEQPDGIHVVHDYKNDVYKVYIPTNIYLSLGITDKTKVSLLFKGYDLAIVISDVVSINCNIKLCTTDNKVVVFTDYSTLTQFDGIMSFDKSLTVLSRDSLYDYPHDSSIATYITTYSVISYCKLG